MAGGRLIDGGAGLAVERPHPTQLLNFEVDSRLLTY